MRISIFLTFLTTKYFQSFGSQIKWQEEKYNFSLSLLWMRRIYFYNFKNPVFCGSIFLCFWTVLHTLLFVIFYLVDSLSYRNSLYNKTKSFSCYFVTNTFPVSPPLTYGIYHRVFLQIILIKFSNLFFAGFYFCFCFQYLKHPSPKFVLFARLPFLTFICLFIWDVFKQWERLCFLDGYTVVSKLLINSFMFSPIDRKYHLYKTEVLICIQRNLAKPNSSEFFTPICSQQRLHPGWGWVKDSTVI